VFIHFSITCITAPTFGVVISGIVVASVGGYASPQTFGIGCFAGFLASIVALPIPFLNSYAMCLFLLWLLLFFGGFAVPILIGILLNSVGPY
jgi:hypothetical protein